MSKKSILIITALLFLSVCIEWYIFGTEQIFKVLVLALGAFLGFYASEIAKKAVRARQVSNQAWAYVVNFDVQRQLEPSNNDIHIKQIIEEWYEAINNPTSNRLEVDKRFQEKLFALIDTPGVLVTTINYWTQNVCTPEKIENFMSDIERGLDELSNWHKYLTDEDIALLGPAISFESIIYRNSQIQMLMYTKSICNYLTKAHPIVPDKIKLETQKFLFFYYRTGASLLRLKSLLEQSKSHGLWEHTKALFGRI